MERKWKIGILALVGALCLVLALSDAASVVSILAQPFDWIGQGLRTMSLSGPAGNVGAIVLYVLVCLSPLALLWKRTPRKEDVLLLGCVVLLFYVMYIMVNPHKITPLLDQSIGKMLLGGAVYSMLIAWGVLKLLGRGAKNDGIQMYRALRIFLMICAAECFVAAFGVGIMELRADIQSIQAANTMPGLDLMPTYAVRFLMFAAAALEYSLDGAVMLRGMKLLGELEADPYSESCVAAADKINGLCVKALALIILSNTVLNVTQAALLNYLHNIDVTVSIPVMSMAVVFGTMALTRLLVQGKEIKDDNDLFV